MLPDSVYHTLGFGNLEKADQPAVYVTDSDGITESRKQGSFFGTDGITRSVRELVSGKDRYAMNARSVTETVLRQCVQFAGTPSDDMCLLAVQLID